MGWDPELNPRDERQERKKAEKNATATATPVDAESKATARASYRVLFVLFVSFTDEFYESSLRQRKCKRH